MVKQFTERKSEDQVVISSDLINSFTKVTSFFFSF